MSWELQGYLAVGHGRDTLQLGTAGMLCGWALRGYLVSWALQGCLVVGQCKDTLQLGIAGIFSGWALQLFKSNNTPARVGEKILRRVVKFDNWILFVMGSEGQRRDFSGFSDCHPVI